MPRLIVVADDLTSCKSKMINDRGLKYDLVCILLLVLLTLQFNLTISSELPFLAFCYQLFDVILATEIFV